MNNALDRTELVIPDRIGALMRLRLKLRRIRHELARDRIGSISGSISVAIAGVMAMA